MSNDRARHYQHISSYNFMGNALAYWSTDAYVFTRVTFLNLLIIIFIYFFPKNAMPFRDLRRVIHPIAKPKSCLGPF